MGCNRYILLFSFIFLIFSEAQNAQAQSWNRKRPRGKTGVTQVGTYPRQGVYADLAYFFGSNSIASTDAEASTQNSFLDLKLGYVNQVGFYYGGQYTFKNNSDNVGNNEGRGSGAGVGYFWVSGFDVRAFYRFHETYGNYRDGSGFQLDVGYSARITPEIYIGVIVDFREINFKIYTLDDTVTSTIMRTLQPAVTIGYTFR